MYKIAILTGISGILLFAGIAQAGNSSHHSEPWQICGEGIHLGNPHCQPSPTIIDPCNGNCEVTQVLLTPELTSQQPSVTSTATPEATVTVQPTVSSEPTIKDSLTPTSPVTPTPTETRSTGSTGQLVVVPQGAPDTSLRE